MKTYLLVLPIIDWARGQRTLDTMHSDVYERTMVVDNAAPKRNKGVSASWNLGVREVIRGELDYLVICSEAIEFGPSKALDLVARLNDTADEYGLEIDNALGWHMIAFSRHTLTTVGEFDEAFFPGYWNDTDYLYRMGLLDLPSPRENGRWMPRCELDIIDHGSALALQAGLVACNFGRMNELYRRKWGGEQGFELFEKPYNR